MVRGVVNANLEAIVNIAVVGPTGRALEVYGVIDTGFTEHLILSHDLVEELGLNFVNSNWMVLADGGMVKFNVFSVTVIWNGRAREVQAIASTGMSLVGMRMLEDHDLHVQVKKGGKVLIESQG